MELEVRLNDRIAKVELIKENNNLIQIVVDGKKYDIDIVDVEECIYSILYKGKSYNVELIETENSKTFTVNTLYETYDVEIIDAESRYIANRNTLGDVNESNIISSPMPGRIVRIPCSTGEEVIAGQTVIVVSAMKMESEYKAPRNGIIKEILVKEGDIIVGHQPLIKIE
jgi:biotin carboxyl carrier protein